MGKGYVYEFLDSNSTIIYVGSTGNIKSRIRHHFRVKNNGKMGEDEYNKVDNIRFARFCSRTEAFVVEAFLINVLSPVYNTRLAENASLSIVNIEINNIPWETMTKDEWMAAKREHSSSRFNYPNWKNKPAFVISEVSHALDQLDPFEQAEYCKEMPWRVAMRMEQDDDGMVAFYHKFPRANFKKLEKHLEEMENSEKYWNILYKYDTMLWKGDISKSESTRLINTDLKKAGFIV